MLENVRRCKDGKSHNYHYRIPLNKTVRGMDEKNGWMGCNNTKIVPAVLISPLFPAVSNMVFSYGLAIQKEPADMVNK